MVDLHLYFDGVASCAILVWPVLLGEQKQSKFHLFKPISSSAHKLSRRPRLFLSIHCGQTYHSVNDHHFPIHVFSFIFFIFHRLRVITNQIIDRLTGKKHQLEEVKDQHHELREKLRDEKLDRDLAEMEAEAELLQAMIDFEDLRHKKFVDNVENRLEN